VVCRLTGGEKWDEGEKGKRRVVCRLTGGEKWDCSVFHGVVDVEIGLIDVRKGECGGKLRLPRDLEGVREAYLVCEYEAVGAEGGRCGLQKAMCMLSPC